MQFLKQFYSINFAHDIRQNKYSSYQVMRVHQVNRWCDPLEGYYIPGDDQLRTSGKLS